MLVVQASISENGNAGWDGKARRGNQSGKELNIKELDRNRNWNYIIRCNDSTIAYYAAVAAVKLAKSLIVGYDQSERNTLYKAIKHYGYDVDAYIQSGICSECDCSSFVYTAYALYIPKIRSDSNAPVTADMAHFYDNGDFVVMPYNNAAALYVGDLLVQSGKHTVMCIGDDYGHLLSEDHKYPEIPTGNRTLKTGTYVLKHAEALKEYPNNESRTLIELPSATIVICEGRFEHDGKRTWLYVRYLTNTCEIRGWIKRQETNKVT